MKNLIMIVAAMIALASNPANANRVGNGGDGYREGGKLYVLDLVEAGVENDPYFDPKVQANADQVARLKQAIPFVGEETAILVSRKLKEIEKKDLKLAWAMLSTIELYKWVMVTPSLMDVPDEETNLDVSNDKLVQLAVRNGRRIMISRVTWPELDSEQQAALIIHEVLYAMIKPEEVRRGHRQNSPKNREFVGMLFSPSLEKLHRAELENFAKGLYPLMDESEIGRIKDGKLWLSSWMKQEVPARKCFTMGSLEWQHLKSPATSEHAKSAAGSMCRCALKSGHDIKGEYKLEEHAYFMYFAEFVDEQGRTREFVSINSSDANSYAISKVAISSANEAACVQKVLQSFSTTWNKVVGMGYVHHFD